MSDLKLFMLLLGCKPSGRNTEQHDTMFAIGTSMNDILPQIQKFWPGSVSIHIDGWREVTQVDGFLITIKDAAEKKSALTHKLFFINLGGYKENELEEFHYKMLSVSQDKGDAVKKAKQTAFYRHTGFKTATSHIDDKYGVDVDDIYEIADILPAEIKEQYCIHIEKSGDNKLPEDNLHLGYFKLSSFS